MSISPPVFPPKNFVPFTFTPNIQYGEVEGTSGSAGYSSKVQAVVAAAAPSDFFYPGGQMDGSREVKHLFGGTIQQREDLARLASPLAYVTAAAPPFLLIHGFHDEIVPFEHAKRMYEVLKAAGGEVTLLSTQEGHDWGGWMVRACTAVSGFLPTIFVSMSTSPVATSHPCVKLPQENKEDTNYHFV